MDYIRTEVMTILSDCPLVVSSGHKSELVNFFVGPMCLTLTVPEARALAEALVGHAERIAGGGE